MLAAVVTAFGEPPRCQEFPTPHAHGEDMAVLDVVAVGLHPRVRSQAAGSHYSSTDELPLIPGVDGVGRTVDGELRYFVLRDTTMGSMAEQAVVDLRASIALPDTVDPVQIAAVMNPAMSSWVALRRRINFTPGQRVLVHGATGNAGQLSVQIAKHLGAGHVTAVGRNAERLAALTALGADRLIELDGEPETVTRQIADAGKDVDVVIDYVWGDATARAIRAIIPARRDDTQRLSWIQIGSVGGLESPIPSAALRAARLELIGSGQGSVATRDILAELPALVEQIGNGSFAVNARAMPLADVEQAWALAPGSQERLVITP